MKSKDAMKEEDIKNKYITPAIVEASQGMQTQIYFEHYFTDRRIILR